MSSALQSTLISARENNYASAAILTALGYDHVLTFSKEIEHIWSKPRTWVSFLFILVRYVGLYGFIIPNFITGFIPGYASTKMYAFRDPWVTVANIFQTAFQGETLFIVTTWTVVLFLGAADLAMILRVWAIYNRSRTILFILLALFSMEIISTVLADVIFIIPRNHAMNTVQMLDFSFCTVQPNTGIWLEISKIASVTLQIVHGAVVCILVIVQFIKQSCQMYHETRQWKINQYMNLLVKQGILYFLAFFFAELLTALDFFGMVPLGWQTIMLLILEGIPTFILAPRFILSIRELHAQDVRGRRGSGIDSGFGLGSGGRAVRMTPVFAHVEQDEGVVDVPSEAETEMQVIIRYGLGSTEQG